MYIGECMYKKCFKNPDAKPALSCTYLQMSRLVQIFFCDPAICTHCVPIVQYHEYGLCVYTIHIVEYHLYNPCTYCIVL